MNQSTLASAFAAAQPRRELTDTTTATDAEPIALDAQALLNAVRRSLQSCQDTSTYRMLLLNLANTAEAAESNQRRFVA